MNEEEGSLLVVTTQKALTPKQREAMMSAMKPSVESMGMKAMVLEKGMEIGLHIDIRPLIKQQIEEQRQTNQLLMMLIEAMSEDEADPDGEPLSVTYMDGTTIRYDQA